MRVDKNSKVILEPIQDPQITPMALHEFAAELPCQHKAVEPCATCQSRYYTEAL